MKKSPLSPQTVMQIATGSWALGVLNAALTHSLFQHLESGTCTAAELAKKARLSLRGTQALLDAVVGLGFVKLARGKYQNSAEASHFLVEGKPAYLGEFVRYNFEDAARWKTLSETVRTGKPQVYDTADVVENPFWEQLVTAIAPLSVPSAKMAAATLRLTKAGAVSILDVGGGSGIYSAIWLGVNPWAHSTQLDWANVNAIARPFVARFGVGNRFHTQDGDFHTAELGRAAYDYVICSNLAHQESPASNIALFRKVRRALKPRGTLVISDFVLNDDRTGHPFAQIFSTMMLIQTQSGAAWRQSDYRAWLKKAGFTKITFQPTSTPSTLIYAQ